MLRVIDRAEDGTRKSATIGVRVEPELVESIDKICRETNMTRSSLITKLLRNYVRQYRLTHRE